MECVRRSPRSKATLYSPGGEPELGDLRFRALMSEEEWAALPAAIRRRFSKRLSGGRTAVYVGDGPRDADEPFRLVARPGSRA